MEVQNVSDPQNPLPRFTVLDVPRGSRGQPEAREETPKKRGRPRKLTDPPALPSFLPLPMPPALPPPHLEPDPETERTENGFFVTPLPLPTDMYEEETEKSDLSALAEAMIADVPTAEPFPQMTADDNEVHELPTRRRLSDLGHSAIPRHAKIQANRRNEVDAAEIALDWNASPTSSSSPRTPGWRKRSRDAPGRKSLNVKQGQSMEMSTRPMTRTQTGRVPGRAVRTFSFERPDPPKRRKSRKAKEEKYQVPLAEFKSAVEESSSQSEAVVQRFECPIFDITYDFWEQPDPDGERTPPLYTPIPWETIIDPTRIIMPLSVRKKRFGPKPKRRAVRSDTYTNLPPGVRYETERCRWVTCYLERGQKRRKTFTVARFGSYEEAQSAALEFRKHTVNW